MKRYGKIILSTLVVALLIIASTTAAFAAGQVWNFDKDAEGWTNNSTDLKDPTFADGKLITEKLAGDPNLTSPDALGIDCSANKYVVVGMKNATAETKLTIYFGTDTADFSEATRVDAEMPANTSDIQKIAVDMSQNENWTGTLKHIRVDPGDGQETGAMEFDYIAVTDNPDSVGTAAAAADTKAAAPAADTKAAASTDTAAAAAPADKAASNPVTADAGVAVYVMMALASAAGMVVRKKK